MIDVDPASERQASAEPIGKRVGGYVYLHRGALDCLTDVDADKVDRATAAVGHDGWNVAKIGGQDISLLLYEDFDAVPFPVLQASSKVDLETGKITTTDYRDRNNPPILHRKEMLLAPFDPRVPLFSALTRQAESHGLFEDVKVIGTRQRWSELLRGKGLTLRGHKLVGADEKPVAVERHRTAITRNDLSQPMSLMRRFGMIAAGTSVFDYGCGQGDDVAALVENGIEAFGWDPHHAPDGPRRPCDVVNLGFVINVIEDPHERVETIKAAWGFARRVMVVSAMTVSKSSVAGLEPYRDGFLTRRGTFQRYFAQDDLRQLVHHATGRRTLSLAPGIVAVFRDEDLEQDVAFRRRSRAEQIAERFVRRDRTVQIKLRAVSQPLLKRIGEQIEVIRNAALGMGRVPNASELPELVSALVKARVSFDRAVAFACDSGFLDQLKEAAGARREDLLVHFAMTLFPGAPRFKTLPRSLQRDVRTFFGSHAAAMAEATQVLFKAGDLAALKEATHQAASNGLGGMIVDAFCFRPEVLERLPVILRVLIGCAEVIHPDLSGWDFVEAWPAKKHVRAFRCEDASKPLPRLSNVVDIDLPKRRVRQAQPHDAFLYLKSRYLRSDEPTRSVQLAVDERLMMSGLVDANGKGPSVWELQDILAARSLPRP